MITDQTKAELYLAYLDRILTGEKDIGPVEDAEVAKLLGLAQSMITVDFSTNKEIRERLRRKLLAHLSPEDTPNQAIDVKVNRTEEDELTDEDLAYAAAGLERQAGETICPYCGARTISLGRCPFCSR
ncbi:hypothetical protein [Desulfosporosinus youngiae]|uniref:Uncharacterized protein n=1 Tax=Desulfosporosinus youngiae DSM 17734 TaxID=768710 RepID=H5Y3E5_9FIRM|nr:hypothetical protein [Desulfosporosinus youngiae]EHQ88914.1 hypothetical protein DesyoDRAFT_1786 [Desulfosporosinus youngiae DSM 17734]